MRMQIEKSVLKGVASLGRKAAMSADLWPSWFGIYQPETPEALKKLRKKK